MSIDATAELRIPRQEGQQFAFFPLSAEAARGWAEGLPVTSSSLVARQLAEVIAYLKCEPGGTYVDATVGRAGHSREILQRSSPTGKLIGLEWDEEAMDRARENLAPFGNRVELIEPA